MVNGAGFIGAAVIWYLFFRSDPIGLGDLVGIGVMTVIFSAIWNGLIALVDWASARFP